MFAWGAYTVYLYATGRINLLLQPVFGRLALAGGLVLLAVFVLGLILRRPHLHEETCPPSDGRAEAPTPAKSSPGHYIRSLAFIIPLVVGLSLPERGLNALAALQRGAADPAMLAELAAQRELQEAREEQGYAWTTVLGVVQRLESPAPQKVGALGFVARPPKMPPDQFLLVRFLITCCAADATPVAVPVRWPDAATLKDNQWIKVFGQTDPEAKVLAADKVEPISQPTNPYM